MELLFYIIVMLLAFANGANDNFKGVATLWGSDTLDFKHSLLLASFFTFAGSLSSYFLASELVQNFSGQALVPNNLAQTFPFLLSVAFGAAATISLAAILGLPVSTTHSLLGGLIGAGISVAGSSLNFSLLGNNFLYPLLLSPVIAIAITTPLYMIFSQIRQKFGITSESCFCVSDLMIPVLVARENSLILLKTTPLIRLRSDQKENCIQQYNGKFLGISFQPLLSTFHYLSAVAVSFARGLNDTPKLISLLLISTFFELKFDFIIVAVSIGLGGLIGAKKVAATMSKKITSLNSGQAFTANFVTSFLVIAASLFGLPVSTTHVSVSSIFGIGLVNKRSDYRLIYKIISSWVITLPSAALLSFLSYFIITGLNL